MSWFGYTFVLILCLVEIKMNKYDESCVNSNCDTKAGLTCREGYCKCMDEKQIWYKFITLFFILYWPN